MYPCDYLAKVGYDYLSERGDVREQLLATKPQPRKGDLNGARWLRLITWPDRVPGLKTWAGRANLPGIISGHQQRLRESTESDPIKARGWIVTAKGQGPSGIDPLVCQDPRDIGFSPSEADISIECRPGVELLAILGLELMPLISFAPRICGFVHGVRLWQFQIEERSGGYSFRWDQLEKVLING
jgi:hypothetical protein